MAWQVYLSLQGGSGTEQSGSSLVILENKPSQGGDQDSKRT